MRDCLLYAGIRGSARFAKLSWFQRDFFYGLLNAADPMGRFEANVDVLRAVLYAPVLSKVSKRDVQGALAACQQAELVKLWTKDGRGYGEVVNYRQRGLKMRRSEIPPPVTLTDDELAFGGVGVPPANAPPRAGDMMGYEEKRREGKMCQEARPSSPPIINFQKESLSEWKERLRVECSGVDVEGELAKAVKHKGGAVEREWFEKHWLPRVGTDVVTARDLGDSRVQRMEDKEPEPDGWREVLFPTKFGAGGIWECKMWREVPANTKAWVREQLGERSKG